MPIETTRVNQPAVDPTATPIDTERRRERRDQRPKRAVRAGDQPAGEHDDDTVTIAPEGAKVDVRA